MNDEIERRKGLVATKETDVDRWSQPESFALQWV